MFDAAFDRAGRRDVCTFGRRLNCIVHTLLHEALLSGVAEELLRHRLQGGLGHFCAQGAGDCVVARRYQ